MVLNNFFDIFSNIFGKLSPASAAPTITVPDSITPAIPETPISEDKPIPQQTIYNNIPARKSDAMTGAQFIANNMKLSGSIRESNILKEFQEGNVPDFIRNFVPITITIGTNIITYCVSPDYLSIGTNQDYCRMPMTPLTAQKIADQYGCVLPTKKMVDDIYKNAEVKLIAIPHGPPYDASMESTERFNWSNTVIEIQKRLNNKPLGSLVAGHKKDVVICKGLLVHKDKVSIYGWFDSNGKPIQGPTPNYTSHSSSYSDYSQCIRLINRKVIINNDEKDIYDIIQDHELSCLVSDEGPYDARTIYK